MSTSSRPPAPASVWADLSWVPFVRPVIAIEECRTPQRYVLRAQLPGLDPTRDVDLRCHHGLLRLRARRERSADATRTEFDCGTATRTVVLPAGALVEQITVRYAGGILEIVVPLAPLEDE